MKYNVALLRKDFDKMRNEWLAVGTLLKNVILKDEYNPNTEKEFLSLKNTIGRHQKVLSQRIPNKEEFDFGGQQISNMLKSQVISLNQVSNRNDQDKRRILQEWHQIFIQTCYVYGAFDFIFCNEERRPNIFQRSIKKVFRQKDKR